MTTFSLFLGRKEVLGSRSFSVPGLEGIDPFIWQALSRVPAQEPLAPWIVAPTAECSFSFRIIPSRVRNEAAHLTASGYVTERLLFFYVPPRVSR